MPTRNQLIDINCEKTSLFCSRCLTELEIMRTVSFLPKPNLKFYAAAKKDSAMLRYGLKIRSSLAQDEERGRKVALAMDEPENGRGGFPAGPTHFLLSSQPAKHQNIDEDGMMSMGGSALLSPAE